MSLYLTHENKHEANLILAWQIPVSITSTEKFRQHTHAETHTDGQCPHFTHTSESSTI